MYLILPHDMTYFNEMSKTQQHKFFAFCIQGEICLFWWLGGDDIKDRINRWWSTHQHGVILRTNQYCTKHISHRHVKVGLSQQLPLAILQAS